MGPSQKVIAIIELCVYIPIFFLAAIVVFRHGFRKQLGWIYLVIFCGVRCAGAGFRLASEANPDNETDQEWSFILQSVGLSPLLMATLGLLKRITDEVSLTVPSNSPGFMDLLAISKVGNIITKRATAISRRSRIIQIAQLPTMIALILCIVGGTDEASSDASSRSEGPKYFKIGIAIFVVIYVLLVALTLITARDVHRALAGERRVYVAVAVALPFIAVRLLYSILAVFTSFKAFSSIDGNTAVELCMALLEEFVVVLMYTAVGLTISK
ncbi:hypothetical protein V496_06509 [Pseudogymnoascus sp. VKM F-4515 (FW-2607)]|nr:hypothetical protein V496_06509 [Pseudogymnoascus sp. VKM F-4515 (FW-2607)]KFY91398.1 hypothetical protein V498_05482 [Pseudogymnoascus sp. VKM F-4517 (FW-2822)]